MGKTVLLGFVLVLVLFSSGCAFWDGIRGCPDGEIEWADSLKVNDINYSSESQEENNATSMKKGEKVGEVKYMLADHACSNHKSRNGDAAYLPVGTEIFEVEGYQPEFRVFAEDRVFQVWKNESAHTIGELYDIEEKVTDISILSQEDDSVIADFGPSQVADFIEDYLSLKYVGYDEVANEIEGNNSAFLRIHLKDGSSFKDGYWLDNNILVTGAYGTERMKRIVEDVLSK